MTLKPMISQSIICVVCLLFHYLFIKIGIWPKEKQTIKQNNKKNPKNTVVVQLIIKDLSFS